MKVIRWGATGLAVAVTLGVTGCSLLDPHDAEVTRAVTEVRQVSGVTAVTHVSLPDGTAAVVVPASDSGAALLAVRDRIDRRLATEGLKDLTADFTVERGMDRISLAAPASQYAYLEKLRYEKPAIAVRIETTSEATGYPRVDVIVATKADVLAGFALVQSTESDPTVAAGVLTVAATTKDGRYELSHSDAFGKIDYIPLAVQLIADPDLVGAKLLDGSDNVGPNVTVRVRSQAEVPSAWGHYNDVMTSYHYFPLLGVNAPNLTSWDDDDPTDAQLQVLRVAIVSGAVAGDVDMRTDLDDRGQLVFTTADLATAKKLNALALAHPEFKKEVPGGFRVYWNHGTAQPERWNFGKPSND
jgi:hypothetical protein